MHIGRHSSGRKVAIELFGAQLQADFRTSFEVNRPLESFGEESGFSENAHGTVNGVNGDNKINILSDHRLRRPMIDRDSSDGTPRDVRSLQTIDQTHYVICAADSLPVVKMFCRHANILWAFHEILEFFLRGF